MKQPKQIVAFGGGGFTMGDALIDDYVLGCARRRPARICFLPTASADSPPYIVMFYRAFAGRDCVPIDLTLHDESGLPRRPATDDELADLLAAQDVVYVGGGNTAHALATWKKRGIDRALRAAWEGGTVMAGLSAGMNCWFASCVTDSFGPLAAMHDGLGLIAASGCPHYDSEPERRPTYHRLVGDGLPAGYAADDGAALHFIDDQLHAVVAATPAAAAYRVELAGGKVVETRLPARYLG